jgi:hypothetical protein|tara:strand:- start:1394 stop:1585 length:192 start_codon:yes stop_codon:yes gene_type:complete
MADKIEDVEFDVDNIDRLEIINHVVDSRHEHGRLVVLNKVHGDFKNMEFSLQDDGKTLKIFIN